MYTKINEFPAMNVDPKILIRAQAWLCENFDPGTIASVKTLMESNPIN